MNRTLLAIFCTGIICAGLTLAAVACKASREANTAPADAPPGTGRQWRIQKETIAADSKEDYVAGAQALRTFDAFGTMEVSQLFYHHHLVMVPAGTLVAEADSAPRPQTPASASADADPKALADRATKVRVLDGPESGHTLWLYPESAEQMGFPAATPSP